MIILVGVGQLLGPMRNRAVEWDNDSTHLIIGGISVDVKGYVMVRVCHKDICSQDFLYVFESLIHFRSPTKGFLTRFVRERFKLVSTFRPHEVIGIDSAKEATHLFEITRRFLFKNCRDAVVSRFEAHIQCENQ